VLSLVLKSYRRDIQAYQGVKGSIQSYDELVDLLESIDHFLNRLDIYTKVPPTNAMTQIVVKILVELLATLALVTKQIKQGKTSKSVFHAVNYITGLNAAQKNSLRSSLERRTSRRYSEDWTDLPWTRVG
jgi:hypothetical protein